MEERQKEEDKKLVQTLVGKKRVIKEKEEEVLCNSDEEVKKPKGEGRSKSIFGESFSSLFYSQSTSSSSRFAA